MLDDKFAVSLLWSFFVATRYAQAYSRPAAIREIVYFFKEDLPYRIRKQVSVKKIEDCLTGWGFRCGEQDALVDMNKTTGGVALAKRLAKDKEYIVRGLLGLDKDRIITHSFIKVKPKFCVTVLFKPADPEAVVMNKTARHQYHVMEYRFNHCVVMIDGVLYAKSRTMVMDEALFDRLLAKHCGGQLSVKTLQLDLPYQPNLPEWAKNNPYFGGVYKRRKQMGLDSESI